jgi:Cu+-exporting ATPase
MAGTNVAARRGILIRDGVALEKSGRITSVVFDKTGTLTQGNLAVAAVEDLSGEPSVPPGRNVLTGLPGRESADSPSVTRLAAAIAQPSNHPLSRAVARLSETHPAAASGLPPGAIQFTDWQEFRGKGVQASWNGATLRLGSLIWLRECGVAPSSPPRPGANRSLLPETNPESSPGFADRWLAQGATMLGLAKGSQLLAIFALRDTIQPHAADVVAQLARQGKATYLITGDHKITAEAIAKQVGISTANVFAQITPEQKVEIIKQLQDRGERVAFVGDGINDAPALEQADLGIAVAQASDVAREAADIILLKSDIQTIPEALGLAQATLRTIKQNLFWAFFYNAAALPLAALGFLSPVICALAMGMSDLVVIGNALRLRHWKG